MMYLTPRNPINVIRTSFGNWIRSIADDQGLPLLSVPQKKQILKADLQVISAAFKGFVGGKGYFPWIRNSQNTFYVKNHFV